MKVAGPVIAAVALALAGCGGEGPPERADYMLQWYPKRSSDYGDLVPGFKSLSMCRRAGSGKTIAAWGGLNRLIQPGTTALKPPHEDGPWFECVSGCRPHMKGGYLLTCEHIVEFRGADSVSPY